MIKFDYSFKKIEFNDLRQGDFFMVDEVLYVKIPFVTVYSLLNPRPDIEKPKYNCYDFKGNRLFYFDVDQEVVKCDIDITARPLR